MDVEVAAAGDHVTGRNGGVREAGPSALRDRERGLGEAAVMYGDDNLARRISDAAAEVGAAAGFRFDPGSRAAAWLTLF
jgi:hypothetical protein